MIIVIFVNNLELLKKLQIKSKNPCKTFKNSDIIQIKGGSP